MAHPLNQMKQRVLDLKAEAEKIFAVAADKRTDEQNARLVAIFGDSPKADGGELAVANTELARLEQIAAAQRAAVPSEPVIETGKDLATDKPWGPPIPANASAKVRQQMLETEFGTFMQAVYNAGTGGGIDPRLMAGPSGASTGVTHEAGFLVRTDWNTMLLDKAQEEAVIAPYCTTIPVGENADGVELPYLNETSRATGSRWGGVRVYRASEAATVTASKPAMGETIEIRLEDLMGLMYTTQRQMRDAASYGAIAAKAFASEFAFVLDDEILRGSGAGQCKGLFNSLTTSSPAGAVISVAKDSGQAAATITSTNIDNMIVRFRGQNGIWLANREILPQLSNLFTPVGTSGVRYPYIAYTPGFAKTRKGQSGIEIHGMPVIWAEQCSALGTIGDFNLFDLSDYLLASKGGLETAESDHVRFIYREKTFRWSRSINGGPATRSVLTPYKGSASLSPYITLATRA